MTDSTYDGWFKRPRRGFPSVPINCSLKREPHTWDASIIGIDALIKCGNFFPSFGPLLSFGIPATVLAAGLTGAVAVAVIAGILRAIRATHTSVLNGLRRKT